MLNFQTQLDWLVTMAQCQGFKAYAWQRAKDLDSTFPGIAEALRMAMSGQVKGSESEGQHQTKPR